MRILIVNYRYFISGGPEKYMFNIKDVLEKHGHEVIPFSVHSDKNVDTEYSKYFVEPIGGRNVTYFDEAKKTPKTIMQMLSRSFYSKEVEKAIMREIDDVKPDLVYIIHFVNKLSPAVIHGAKKKGMPVVMRLSDYHMLCPGFHFLYDNMVCEDCLTKGYGCCIKKKCIKNSLFASVVRVFSMKYHKTKRYYHEIDAFVSPSEFMKTKMQQNGFDKSVIECIPTFMNAKEDYEANSVGDYGLYVGRVSKEKGVEYIVKAYEDLPTHRLVIMGDDTTNEADNLKRYITEKGLNNIDFIGFKSGKELTDIIKSARFTIIPSIWYENLPNSCLESFYYRKPVIASNIGSLPESVKDKYNGLLFETGNAEELRKCIMSMDDDELVVEYGEKSRELLDTKYSVEAHYEALLKLFSNVTDKR